MKRSGCGLGCLLRSILILIVLGGLAAAGVAALVLTPYQGFKDTVYLDFPMGTSTGKMAEELARAGVIRSKWQFLAVRGIHPGARLQAGEYAFTKPASAYNVFDRIVRGDVFYVEVTIPEGSNIFDIANILNGTGIIKSADFLKAAADVTIIRDLDPKATTLEGYLFPSTYRMVRSTTASQMAHRMTDQFRKEWKAMTETLTPPPDVHDIVTLASLVEKETGVPQERPAVASVYANRLRIGMKLDCDPTTIYAAMIEDRYRGTIHQSDLASKNAYNTYQHPGLPPGPIANPGSASLKAAISPLETNYLYFVAKGDGSGSHRFSADYAGHLQNVEAYRRGQSKAGTSR